MSSAGPIVVHADVMLLFRGDEPARQHVSQASQARNQVETGLFFKGKADNTHACNVRLITQSGHDPQAASRFGFESRSQQGRK